MKRFEQDDFKKMKSENINELIFELLQTNRGYCRKRNDFIENILTALDRAFQGIDIGQTSEREKVIELADAMIEYQNRTREDLKWIRDKYNYLASTIPTPPQHTDAHVEYDIPTGGNNPPPRCSCCG